MAYIGEREVERKGGSRWLVLLLLEYQRLNSLCRLGGACTKSKDEDARRDQDGILSNYIVCDAKLHYGNYIGGSVVLLAIEVIGLAPSLFRKASYSSVRLYRLPSRVVSDRVSLVSI